MPKLKYPEAYYDVYSELAKGIDEETVEKTMRAKYIKLNPKLIENYVAKAYKEYNKKKHGTSKVKCCVCHESFTSQNGVDYKPLHHYCEACRTKVSSIRHQKLARIAKVGEL